MTDSAGPLSVNSMGIYNDRILPWLCDFAMGGMHHGGAGMMSHMGQEESGKSGMGRMGMTPMMGGKGPSFAFRAGQGSFMVKCAADESTKACVDAILPLLDKVHSLHPMGRASRNSLGIAWDCAPIKAASD